MFWQWFYTAMKFTREFLKGLWEDGLIEGFVTEKDMARFSKCEPGTFMLRFSNNVLGKNKRCQMNIFTQLIK